MTEVFATVTTPDRYPPTSRYHGIPRKVHVTADGRELPYTARRLLPDPAKLTELGRHEVTDGERLDQVAHRYLGDAEQWWRIADANPAEHPRDLVAEPGRELVIGLSEGMG